MKIIVDVAVKLDLRHEEVFLIALLMKYNGISNEEFQKKMQSIYDIYHKEGRIPEWMENWCIDVLIGKIQIQAVDKGEKSEPDSTVR